MKNIYDTEAAKKLISAIVLNRKGELVAKILGYRASYGNTWVQVCGTSQPRRRAHDLDSALHGLVIDGVTLYRQCVSPDDAAKILTHVNKLELKARLGGQGLDPVTQKAIRSYLDKRGMDVWNWRTAEGGWTSVFYTSGLARLEQLGYRVIRVLGC
ncbi:MAG: hypothetical protein WCZ86_06225 [Desulfurivibrionaceae bacterium]